MSYSREYAPLFIEHLAPAMQAEISSPVHLEQVLRDVLSLAEATWGDLSVPAAAYLRFLAERIPAGARPEEALLKMRIGDLYLVCACLRGETRAVAELESIFGREIDVALARIDSSLVREDARDALYHELLFGRDGGAPKLERYAGRGDLRSWLRVSAVRKAQDMLRREKKKERLGDDDLVNLVSPEEDQELEYLKRLYKKEFKAAFEEALASLSTRERNILRHQLLDGLNHDQIAAMYHVHRITVVRWCTRIREQLLERTRDTLMSRLEVSRAGFASITRLLQSQFDVSLRRHLFEMDRSQVRVRAVPNGLRPPKARAGSQG